MHHKDWFEYPLQTPSIFKRLHFPKDVRLKAKHAFKGYVLCANGSHVFKNYFMKKDSSYFLHKQQAKQINIKSMIEAHAISSF